MTQQVTSSTRSFREIVEKLDDPNRHRDSLYPVVYVFSNNRQFRDSGPDSIYSTDE